MGNKISTYTAITTLANGDLLDISKDMGASTYATRKITYANLLVELTADLAISSSNLGNANLTANNVARTYTLAGTSTEYLAFLDGAAAEILKLKGDRTILMGGYTTNGFVKTSAGTGLLTVSTQVAATEGGTGISSYTTGDILYSSASNTLAKLAAGTNGYILTLAGGVPTWAAASNLGGSNLTSSSAARTFTLAGSADTDYLGILTGGASNIARFRGDGKILIGTTTNVSNAEYIFGDAINTKRIALYGATDNALNVYNSSYLFMQMGGAYVRYYNQTGAGAGSDIDIRISTTSNNARITTNTADIGVWQVGYVHQYNSNNIVRVMASNGSGAGIIEVNKGDGTVKNILSGNRASVEPTWFGEGAQMGGTRNSIDASALLDLQSTTQGLGLPSMTTAQKNAISSPRAGLFVFDDDLNQISYYTGAAWVNL